MSGTWEVKLILAARTCHRQKQVHGRRGRCAAHQLLATMLVQTTPSTLKV